MLVILDLTYGDLERSDQGHMTLHQGHITLGYISETVHHRHMVAITPHIGINMGPAF